MILFSNQMISNRVYYVSYMLRQCFSFLGNSFRRIELPGLKLDVELEQVVLVQVVEINFIIDSFKHMNDKFPCLRVLKHRLKKTINETCEYCVK